MLPKHYGTRDLEEALRELPRAMEKFVRANIAQTNKLGEMTTEQFQRLLRQAIRNIETLNASKGVLLIGYCMDERCSTCGVETACQLAGINKNEVENGSWKVIKFRFPPYFAGKDLREEESRMVQAAQRLAERIGLIIIKDPSLKIRILETIHEGCGAGAILHKRGWYKVKTWQGAVKKHHEKFLWLVGSFVARSHPDRTIRSEIADLPLGMMQPKIEEHYATACIIGMLGQHDILQLHPLTQSGKLPKTYQINGQYLRDPATLGEIAALAAHINAKGHALPGLVTKRNPFQYIIVYRKENGKLVQETIRELEKRLAADGLKKMAIIKKVEV